MTTILGISAFFHDSAAALIVDGRVIAAAQEERFTRIKHDASFPTRAIASCLEIAGIETSDIDYVAFYEKPFLKFERILETHLQHAPFSWKNFVDAMPVWLRSKLFISRTMARNLKGYDRKIVFPEHHQSHAASAFFPSPFERAAILTVDGVGEWATTTIGVGRGNQIQLTDEIRFPDSSGLLYSAFTAFCGFRVNGGEGKLMGLAPYGQPNYVGQILEHVIEVRADGSFRLNPEYFDYCRRPAMPSKKFAALFGGPPRVLDSEISDRERDLAASIQQVTELILLRMANHLHQTTGESNLCLAGGVALNCVANGRLARETSFEKVWVQPAAGDSGGAIGAALFVWFQLLQEDREVANSGQRCAIGMQIGPANSESQIAEFLKGTAAVANRFEDNESLYDFVVNKIQQQKIVGWCQGRMEFGPRALGGRSILADPRDGAMKDRINEQVKFRESFRPFAPAVLESHCEKYFEVHSPAPFMTFAGKVKPHVSPALPAITHVDGTARVQTVAKANQPCVDPNLHGLLFRFHAQTGCAALLNTSFNVRGEPIVNTAEEAYRCFLKTGLDVLVVGRWVLCKDEQGDLEFEKQKMLAADRFRARSKSKSVFRRILDAWKLITFPLRWLVSLFVLGLIYFLLVTPLGWFWRRLRERPKQDRLDNSNSFWVKRENGDAADDARYFKQF